MEIIYRVEVEFAVDVAVRLIVVVVVVVAILAGGDT